jgi:hypothetical protein
MFVSRVSREVELKMSGDIQDHEGAIMSYRRCPLMAEWLPCREARLLRNIRLAT